MREPIHRLSSRMGAHDRATSAVVVGGGPLWLAWAIMGHIRRCSLSGFIFLAAVLLAGCGWQSATGLQTAPQELVLATTTSTYDSGLLDAILPDFEKTHHARVKVIAVGTGQAIKTGEQGDADVLLVHARAKEDKFVADGHGVNRRDVMTNDFVILGPEADPAGIRGTTDASQALVAIARAQATFASRGDESGTHSKEKVIWKKAGLEPAGDWYLSLGQGMGATLTVADEKGAYTLADRGTYLARKDGLGLIILVEGDPILFNPYGVIAVNPAVHPGVNYDLAMAFIEWLTSPETQKKIGEFGVEKFGQPLFHPVNEATSE